MNKKQLQKEIDSWQAENIIDNDTAIKLKARYSAETDKNTLMIIFSVIGCLLIGAGLVLILAKNWYSLPDIVKTILSFFPLVASQALAIYTLKKKPESLIWREGISVLWCAGIFCAVAMVGQTYNTADDYGGFMLVCGLLCLPIIYLLNAVAPLAVYYFSILNWCAYTLDDTENPYILLISLALLGAGLAYVIINRKNNDARNIYTIWLSVVAGFAYVMTFSIALETNIFCMLLLYFIALFAISTKKSSSALPFKPLGMIGSIIIILLLSSGYTWTEFTYADPWVTIFTLVLTVIVSCLSILFVINYSEKDFLKLVFLISAVIVSFLCVLALFTEQGFSGSLSYVGNYAIAYTFITNIIAFFLGIGFIVYGTKDSNFGLTNLGLFTVFILVMIRFFDQEIDFLLKGIIFLLLGGGILFVNFWMIRKKKLQEAAVSKFIENTESEGPKE